MQEKGLCSNQNLRSFQLKLLRSELNKARIEEKIITLAVRWELMKTFDNIVAAHNTYEQRKDNYGEGN